MGKYTKELPDTEEQDVEQERKELAPLPEGVTLTDTVPPGVMEQNQDGTYNAYDAEGNKAGTVTAEEYESAGKI